MNLSQHILTTAELMKTGMTSRNIHSALKRQELIKLRRGVYLQPDAEQQLDERDWVIAHHIAERKALKGSSVLTRESAALMWDTPLTRLPRYVHLASSQKDKGKYRNVKLHVTAASAIERAQPFDDYRVLTPTDTVISCVRSLPAHETLIIANDFLKRGLCSPGLLSEQLHAVRGKGNQKARRIARCLTPQLDSPLENIAYLVLTDSNVEPVNLQMWLTASSGRRYRPDFCWPRVKLILEVDGMVKYNGTYGTAERRGAYEYQRQRD
ncbi:MAG: type IV toxin-antitoxin system AbiEi family antitoxin domain-containing protein [Rothia sp. (in: high G+C Gram-positive bacteria)]|uniref:type IV toxin-antitoxin system AbiEi family antitoxin domain-containing protein n=1 Tax=Rothia sp. (in: high G+C Gram-positive bacteria) TaxID=1885016 RepID=UPI0026F7E08A|nr:type IV toxin-antitoxin system AbiEi family antitoxin domain-containing protein [Rothia sp. (in: high G+C Gram-positive bacteria)]